MAISTSPSAPMSETTANMSVTSLPKTFQPAPQVSSTNKISQDKMGHIIQPERYKHYLSIAKSSRIRLAGTLWSSSRICVTTYMPTKSQTLDFNKSINKEAKEEVHRS